MFVCNTMYVDVAYHKKVEKYYIKCTVCMVK